MGSVSAALSGPAFVPLGKERRLTFPSQRLETEPRITTISGFEEPGRGQNHATSYLRCANLILLDGRSFGRSIIRQARLFAFFDDPPPLELPVVLRPLGRLQGGGVWDGVLLREGRMVKRGIVWVASSSNNPHTPWIRMSFSLTSQRPNRNKLALSLPPSLPYSVAFYLNQPRKFNSFQAAIRPSPLPPEASQYTLSPFPACHSLAWTERKKSISRLSYLIVPYRLQEYTEFPLTCHSLGRNKSISSGWPRWVVFIFAQTFSLWRRRGVHRTCLMGLARQ